MRAEIISIMNETIKKPDRVKAPRLLKAMTFLALAGWMALGAVFAGQGGVPKSLEWLYGLCAPFFFIANFAIALSYVIFRTIDSIHSKSWSDYRAWTWLPTISLVIALAFGSLKSVAFFKGDFDDSKDLQALKAGQSAKTVQQRYFLANKKYANDLAGLLEIDPEIAASPEITFKFYKGNESEFRFATHAKGSKVIYPFSNKGLHPFGEVKVKYVGDPLQGGLPRRKDFEKEN